LKKSGAKNVCSLGGGGIAQAVPHPAVSKVFLLLFVHKKKSSLPLKKAASFAGRLF